MKKKNVIILIIFFILIIVLLYFKFLKKEKVTEIETLNSEESNYSSNIIEDVYYSSKDSNGNEYIIRASKGEIDFSQNEVLYLTDVKALIKLTSSNDIEITSSYGKYNSNNFDTIFSKNVIINYLDNRITGEYLDFSIQRNSMVVSRDVIYTNLENILKADVMEINIDTKDTKIFMHKNNEKVNIKTK
jgi:LPS export ABC transporter protein LptC